MTRTRNDCHSTEFGMWLRTQEKIDSRFGFIATNIDYLWENYKTGNWMIIEEKRYGASISFSQKKQFENLIKNIKPSNKFKGFHFLQFENTSPEDGKIYLDGKQITQEELIKFLLMQ